MNILTKKKKRKKNLIQLGSSIKNSMKRRFLLLEFCFLLFITILTADSEAVPWWYMFTNKLYS